MDDIIPSEIKLNNIFTRLPATSVLECRRVCKSWRNLLQFHHDTHFAYLHLRNHHGLITKHHQPLNKDFGTMRSFLIFDRQSTYYTEYHDEEEQFFHATRINLTFPVNMQDFLVSSFNGLICLSPATECNEVTYYPRGPRYPERVEPLYICNPITREILTIPGFYVNENGVNLVHGFGYHPLTNEYKVVRICYHEVITEYEFLFQEGNVEVYTLGNGKGWRNIGQIDYYIVPNTYDKTGNMCVNGALHWLKYETGDIVAFDLADEEFHLVAKPPGLSSDSQSCSRIFVMNGCLCLAYEDDGVVDLWMLKTNGEEENIASNQQLDLAKEQYYKSWSWNNEFHIATEDIRFCELGCVTKGGDLLFFHFTGYMTRYNPKATTSKTFVMHTVNNNRMYHPRMISHANSFVSLKALGEVNVETCLG